MTRFAFIAEQFSCDWPGVHREEGEKEIQKTRQDAEIEKDAKIKWKQRIQNNEKEIRICLESEILG